jgi:Amiloride-sensitive sodium channel
MALSSLLDKICSQTTCHGIPDWYRAKGKWAKRTWTLILLAASAGIIYYTWSLLDTYIRVKTGTRIVAHSELKLLFPNITVYPTAKLNYSFYQQWAPIGHNGTPGDSANDFLLYLESALWSEQQQLPLPDATSMGTMEAMYQSMFNTSLNGKALSVPSFFNMSRFRCEEYLTYCAFIGILFPCCKGAVPAFTDMGICWQMTLPSRIPKQPAHQIAPGMSNCFYLEAAFHQSSDFKLSAWDVAGIRIHIGREVIEYDPNPVHVSIGKIALVTMSMETYQRHPKSNCTNDPPPLAYSSEYHQERCWKECVFNLTVSECGCTSLLASSLSNHSHICSPLQVETCRKNQSLVREGKGVGCNK